MKGALMPVSFLDAGSPWRKSARRFLGALGTSDAAGSPDASLAAPSFNAGLTPGAFMSPDAVVPEPGGGTPESWLGGLNLGAGAGRFDNAVDYVGDYWANYGGGLDAFNQYAAGDRWREQYPTLANLNAADQASLRAAIVAAIGRSAPHVYSLADYAAHRP